jgi:rhomboid protease GluP
MGSYPPSSPSDGIVHEEDFAQPEVMPPAAEYASPSGIVRRPKPIWAAAPGTNILVAINCLVFVAMLTRGLSIWAPTPEQLMQWGANNAGSVLVHGEWWRIVTAMFVHVGILHLATNMWCLWNLGLLAEPLMGSFGLFAVYILTGAAGNLLSTGFGWAKYGQEWVNFHANGGLDVAAVFPPGAGASGAVFGIAGALIVLLKSNRLPVPPDELKKLRRSVIYFAGLNLVLGLSITGVNALIHSGLDIDNYAHLGGFACGLMFAAPMVPRIGSPRKSFETRLRAAVGLVVGVLVLFGFYLTKFAG